VYSHLARCIEEGELTVGEVVKIPDNEVKTIEYAFSQLGHDSPFTLKPVFDACQGKYDYGLLRCVRAGLGLSES
jgi:ATP-dependent DNA helicase RecQ